MKRRSNLEWRILNHPFIQGWFLFLCMICFFAPSGYAAEDLKSLYQKSMQLYSEGKLDESAASFLRVIQLNSRFAPGYVGLAMVKQAQSKPDAEILALLEQAVTADPNSSMAHSHLGKIYYSISKFDLAEEHYLKALQSDNSLVDAKLALAWLYLLGKSMPAEAVSYFKQSLPYAESNPNIYYGLGLAYLMNNDRVMTLDMITSLRRLGELELANKLEYMVNQNATVVSEEGKPLVHVPEEQLKRQQSIEDARDQARSQVSHYPSQIEELPVRLSGPLP